MYAEYVLAAPPGPIMVDIEQLLWHILIYQTLHEPNYKNKIYIISDHHQKQ